MSEEINTSEGSEEQDQTLSEESDVNSSDGNEADNVASVKEVIGETLGKEFKTDNDALDAVKNTFKYVGKTGKYQPLIQKLEENLGGEGKALELLKTLSAKPDSEQKTPEVEERVGELEKMVKESNFYTEHPEYKPYKDLISKFGDDPVKAVEDESFKSVFDKLKAQDEGDEKSVLHSKSRLGQVTDKVSQAKKLTEEGKEDEGANTATDAVIDAFELEKK